MKVELNEFGERLAMLRSNINASARNMSLSIGQSANYINKIENGRIFPSMTMFFDICEFLKISPKEFFDIDSSNPNLIRDMVNNYNRLDSTSQSHVAGIVKELARDGK